jgi:outer membrane protein assembly factor BamA
VTRLGAAVAIVTLLVLPAVGWAGPIDSGRPRQGTTPPTAEVIAEIRLHGNQLTSDADLLELAGVTTGAPFTQATLQELAERLRRTGRFRSVQVLKRFASIADPSRITLVVIVDEGPVDIDVPGDGGPAQVVRRRAITNLLVMPVLDIEDGYGATYGVRLAYAGVAGRRSRLSFPLTWGGLKQAGVELERTFADGPLSRVRLGASVDRRRNPAFDEHDDRRRVWGRAGRAFGPLRMDAGASSQRVAFGGEVDRLRSVVAEVALDTRLDPALPRHAVYALAAVEGVSFASGRPSTTRLTLDGRGYVGLIGQAVVVARAQRESASGPLPPYLKSLLGGDGNLRGFEPGAFVGDALVAGSLELRLPLSAALSAGKVGVSVFADAGAAYDHGQRFRDQTLQVGGGASVWLAATVFRMGLTVAHGRGAGTRVTFGAGLSR